ncbi:hypothetical protein FRACYDRAFT_231964 [Fragilariopsis cylindrus CCMP1102]|uniref:Uncharacterized protein n=1 Tax=Fragilariopsis cylindrus CCMP1102 TaxID=635003 RepID=A0A1E7FUM7_9STRA|nr:hypothetical protein FRACYDRAFT_231964 [Fragilariopsis cylindrus CCMP1102]|eukprot:OEU21817.1 hypothetical protein FRACYDRAFT_231964 [Fragilariopsis cylindrus CCMP1102]
MTVDPKEHAASLQKRIIHLSALFQLLWHLTVTRRNWFSDDDELPRVAILRNNGSITTTAAVLRQLSAWMYVSLILAQMILIVTARETTKSSLGIKLALATVLTYLIQTTLGDATQIQPPVIHGLALLMCDDVLGAQIVLSGTWMWAGLHKINPRFLLEPIALVDAVFLWVLPAEFVSRHRVGMHGMVAVAEALAGAILLFTTAKRQHAYSGLCTNIGLASGVNALHHFGTVGADEMELLRHWMEHELHATFGWLDPYLGNAVYSSNNPTLEMELPDIKTDRVKSLYNSWRFFVGEDYEELPRYMILPARSHDGRYIYRIDLQALYMLVKDGSVGYPAAWCQQRFVEALCEQLDFPVDAEFRLTHHYTGKILFKGLLDIMRGADGVQLKPVTMLRQSCKSSWLPVDQGDQSNKVTADFSLSSSMTDHFDDIELHWLRGNLDPVADAAGLTRWHAKLVFQEILGAKFVASTYIGHYFVATTVQDGHPCVLDVFVMTHEPRQQHFILDKISSRAIPGIKSCVVDFSAIPFQSVQTIQETQDEIHDEL